MSARKRSESRRSFKRFSLRIRRHLLSGVLILVPFTVTLVVILWLFGWFKRLLNPIITRLVGFLINLPNIAEVPPIYLKILVSGVAVLMVLILLYLIGAIGTKVMGKRLIAAIEALILRVPLARTLYTATKQVVDTFGSKNHPAYKSVVLVEFPRPGFMAVGFLMGYVVLANDQRFAKVFIPTSPNPTTGFFEMVPVDQVQETELTVEDAFKMILSGGLVSSGEIPSRPISDRSTVG